MQDSERESCGKSAGTVSHRGGPGSRAVVGPIPRVGLLEERPAVSGRRERTQREELQCQVEDDTAEGMVVKTVTDRIFTSLGQCNDRLTARVCTFRVIDRGKSETMISSSRDHELLEVLLDRAYAMAENRESRTCGFSKDQWLNNVGKLVNEVITSNVQALMVVKFDHEVKVDQEASIADVKFICQCKSCGELRSVGGSSNVSKESPMTSAASALIEKSVRETQSTVRTIVAYIAWVYGTTFESGGASSIWTAEIVGHVIRSQSSVADVKTACERKSNRKAWV